MGQVCSGEKSESRKAGAFEETSDLAVDFTPDRLMQEQQQQQQIQQQQGILGMDDPYGSKEEDQERLKAMREEQARLDMIVSAASRGMVAVRSTRGSTGYYDQGFAAALAQHLEQTTQFPDRLEVRLPPPSTTLSVYERLSQPPWENIVLGTAGSGLAGCGGEDPIKYMDNMAESLLDEVIPTKQRLFSGASPMVENLM